MKHWIITHLTEVIYLTLFLITLAYVFWLRFRMLASKARFALAVIINMLVCCTSLLKFLNGAIFVDILNAGLAYAGTNQNDGVTPYQIQGLPWYFGIFGTVITATSLILIYRFSMIAILNWEGPLTLTVNDLAKERQDNNLMALALAEIRRLAARKPDLVASHSIVNWEQKITNAPAEPNWPLLALNLFDAAYNEAEIPENGWHDRFQAWMGEIYTSFPNAAQSKPLCLLLFDEEPSDRELQERIEDCQSEEFITNGTKVFVIFNEGTSKLYRKEVVNGFKLEILPKQALLTKGVKLDAYARDLIRRFDKDTLGGTDATLSDTFVEAHVKKPKQQKRYALDTILSNWLNDTTRRHLAITGEYGQGKSTAMLNFCANWARRYLKNGAPGEKVPFLIELRGHNPAESDPVTFLSAWAGRYGFVPKQLFGLIQAGQAIVIFEGFDELRNAGREYERHEHFNALWSMGFPGTKLIFTGRPNFFLGDKEKNRTLRADPMNGAAGNAYSELWELDLLKIDEIEKVVYGFGSQIGASIMASVSADAAFFDIVSRPSMLPVVATIWPKIQSLQEKGQALTSGILVENYLQAIYQRKEAEIENQKRLMNAPKGASYLYLPREVREFFTLAIVWEMANKGARNTINRHNFNEVIEKYHDDVFHIFKSKGMPPKVAEQMKAFEERYIDDTRADRLERISNEVASAGIFVPDPVGGHSNLRLPHKQFYEYIIAKAAWFIISHKKTIMSKTLIKYSPMTRVYNNLLSERNTVTYMNDFLSISLKELVTFEVIIKVKLLLLISSIRVSDLLDSYTPKFLIKFDKWAKADDTISVFDPISVFFLSNPSIRKIIINLNKNKSNTRWNFFMQLIVYRYRTIKKLDAHIVINVECLFREAYKLVCNSPYSLIINDYHKKIDTGYVNSDAHQLYLESIAPIV